MSSRIHPDLKPGEPHMIAGPPLLECDLTAEGQAAVEAMVRLTGRREVEQYHMFNRWGLRELVDGRGMDPTNAAYYLLGLSAAPNPEDTPGYRDAYRAFAAVSLARLVKELEG